MGYARMGLFCTLTSRVPWELAFTRFTRSFLLFRLVHFRHSSAVFTLVFPHTHFVTSAVISLVFSDSVNIQQMRRTMDMDQVSHLRLVSDNRQVAVSSVIA